MRSLSGQLATELRVHSGNLRLVCGKLSLQAGGESKQVTSHRGYIHSVSSWGSSWLWDTLFTIHVLAQGLERLKRQFNLAFDALKAALMISPAIGAQGFKRIGTLATCFALWSSHSSSE